ncbi:MAG: hypothetical protein A2359_02885 [Candidatus Moranbacteria bacterium RIFOXYB1_FULL_43_19]|nr:MAG: hypothetical protein A2184_02050 [Candidatus Moranbacteria bacterium RIFOXYA1_FULL_44_7]OGI27762.1 MAG: hypothetical protein A2359_02885 [Candidatus Moranbacteria bacterium RIFOXYB1_FULL_43_19]OGI33981.1 MAG: hypothetical protein A2420_03735 [Candidatus Moranbacteria bacterium RIFOXYC1_FULL_44_13]OGI37327.1 MAG: hypothetical protein A2612_05040 [Candidatus Moranbacteria bacterium RIFOXYD1_FULL_44_12]
MKVFGKVKKGEGKGAKLGFPTVNVELEEKTRNGVYAGSAKLGDKNYKAGIFVNLDGKLLEAHLVGFSGDLYGEEIEIKIGKKIRNVMKFKSEEELERQIKKDISIISNF